MPPTQIKSDEISPHGLSQWLLSTQMGRITLELSTRLDRDIAMGKIATQKNQQSKARALVVQLLPAIKKGSMPRTHEALESSEFVNSCCSP
jgi:hypothetical protein